MSIVSSFSEAMFVMDWELALTGIIVLALLIYLVYSLLYPEKF
jgi:K+-transporting ATPase KdpF subunit